MPLVHRLEGLEPLPRGALARLIVLGVVGNTLYQFAFISGLERTTASNSALILASMPTIVAVMAVGARTGAGPSQVLGGVLVATLACPGSWRRGDRASSSQLTGDLLTLAAVVCWAGYTLGSPSVAPGDLAAPGHLVTTVAGAPALLLAGMPDHGDGLGTRWDGRAGPPWPTRRCSRCWWPT